MLNRTIAPTSSELKSAIVRTPLVVAPNTTVIDAVVQMSHVKATCKTTRTRKKHLNEFCVEARSSCVFVVENDQLLGILTEQDIVNLSAQRLSLQDLAIQEVMSSPIITLYEAAFTNLFVVINLFQQYGIRHLPILDEHDRLVGFVTPESLQQISHLIDTRAEREKLVAQIANSIRSSLDVQQILATCVSEVRAFLGCDRVLVYQFQPDWSGIIIAESVDGHWLSALGNQINDSCFQRQSTTLYSSEQPIVVNNIYATGYADCHIKLLEQYQVKANLVVPIRVAGQLWGLLIGHQCAEQREWQTDDTTLLQTISVQLAIALQQATTYEQLQAELHEHQQTEARLRASEQRYATLAAAVPVGIFCVNASGDCTYVNQHWCQLTGLSPEAAMGKGWQQSFYSKDRNRILAEWAQSVQELRPACLEFRIQCPDGQMKWVYGQAVVEWDASGSIIGHVATLTDISDRKQAELALAILNAELEQRVEQRTAELQEREAQLQDFFENANDLIQSVDLETGRFEYVNRAWRIALGYSIEDLQTLTIFDILHPDCYDQCCEAMTILRAGNVCTREPLELVFLTKTQQAVVVEGSINCRMENDRPVATRAIFRDVTERKAAEKRLQEREARYRALMDGASDAILLTDPQGNVLEANHQAEKLLGYSRAELTSMHFTQLHQPEQLSGIVTSFEGLANQRFTQVLDVNFRCKDGHLIPVDISASVIEIQGERIVQGFFRDISERKQAELERQQLVQELAMFKMGLDQAAIVAMTDAKGVITYANDLFCKVSGYSHDELIGQTHRLVNSGYHPPTYFRQMWRTIARGQVWRGEICNRTKDGSIYWVDTTLVPFLDKQGKAFQYLAIRIDITARKLAEAALQKSETRFRRVFDSDIVGMMFTDFSGKITEANDRFLQIIGYSRADLTANRINWATITPPEYHLQDLHAIEHLQSHHAIDPWEKAYYHKDGHPVPVLVGVAMLSQDDDTCVSVVVDISDRKQSEDALRESQQFLQTVLDAFPLSVFWKDRDSIYLGCNQKFTDTTGLQSPRHIVGKTDFDFCYTEAEALSYRADDRQVMESGIPLLGIEETITLPTGEQRWLETNKIPLRDLDGNVVAMVGTFQDITDRKYAEDQLRNLSARLTLALQAGAIGTWDWNLTDAVNWDERVYEIYGLQDLDYPITYQDWGKQVHPDDLKEIEYLFQDVIQGKQELDVEFRIHRTDGALRWVRSKALAQRDDQGNLVRMTGINQDITDQKQTEATIRQQFDREQLLRETTQRIRQSLDLQTIFDTACQEIRSIIQADRVGIFKFYPKSNFDDGEFVAESVLPGFSSVVAIPVHDRCFGTNYSNLYAKGRYHVVDDIYKGGLSACHSNILTQFQVRANLVTPLLCGNVLWGLLCVHQCSSARHWQQSEIEFTHQIANQLAIAIQQANLFEHLQRELIERQQAETKLTESNQQLAISNQELARATRLKDEFLATMSHELRTPLNAILGMTEGLQEAVFGIINPQQLKALQTIERSGLHLLELINDILDVAKIEAGQIELDLAFSTISSLCQSSLAFIKQQALKKNIQVDTKLQPNLPDLLVDERRIRQVLINLLNNAVKFTPEGGYIVLEVAICEPEAERQAHQAVVDAHSWIRFSVIDTGIGIAPENIDKLFQPFIQIDSALNRQYTGTGLGLALVKRIVELHGGKVGLTSQLGAGSCFTIDLPYTPSAPSLSASPKVNQSQTTSTLEFLPTHEPASQAPLILLAEDNEANISTVSNYLEAKGYRILLAKNGQEAIDLAKTQHPNFILMDVQMPEVDGLTAIKQIRLYPDLVNVPIVALTALAMKGDRERCLAAGANDYLSKPVRLKQLAAIIQSLLA